MSNTKGITAIKEELHNLELFSDFSIWLKASGKKKEAITLSFCLVCLPLMLLMKHTVVFTSWCPPATAQQNPAQAPPAKMQAPTWRSLSVGRSEKAGDNVVVENMVVTKKHWEIPTSTWWFQQIFSKKNTSQIRDNDPILNYKQLLLKRGWFNYQHASVHVRLDPHISSVIKPHIFSQKNDCSLRSWVRWCWHSWRECPQQKKWCFVWFYMV